MNKQLEVMIMRFDMIGALHWYVTCEGKLSLQKKFLDIEDAREYAKSITPERNIEIFDNRIE